MIELLVVGVLVMAAAVILPLLALKLLLELGLGILMLPFKILGGVFHALFGALGFVFKLVGGLLGAVVTVVAVILALVFLPLLPLFIVGGLVWMIVRKRRFVWAPGITSTALPPGVRLSSDVYVDSCMPAVPVERSA